MTGGYSPVDDRRYRRTDMHCHACEKTFVAELDYGVNGDHVIECPHCGHEHCRTIQDGLITESRWDSRGRHVVVRARSVWKSSVMQARTSTAAQFIRDRWLNLGDGDG